MRIWVRYKNNPSVLKNISESDFDENKMEKVENKENKAVWKDILSSHKAPGIVSSRNQSSSGLSFHGKLDEGSVGNFLDEKLESAETRAAQRNKKYGSSFKKIKRPIRRKK